MADQSAAAVRVFDMLLERLARIEDGVGRLGAYLGQRQEELPPGSEVGAELELELGDAAEVRLGEAPPGLRLIKCYDGRFRRSSDLFMVETPSAAAVRPSASASDLDVPEVIAVGEHMLVDLARGSEAERRLPPLQQLYRVVRRVAMRLDGPTASTASTASTDSTASTVALEVHALPTYAQEVARKLVEEGVEAAARAFERTCISKGVLRHYCNTVCAESVKAPFPHPLSDVWPHLSTHGA